MQEIHDIYSLAHIATYISIIQVQILCKKISFVKHYADTFQVNEF